MFFYEVQNKILEKSFWISNTYKSYNLRAWKCTDRLLFNVYKSRDFSRTHCLQSHFTLQLSFSFYFFKVLQISSSEIYSLPYSCIFKMKSLNSSPVRVANVESSTRPRRLRVWLYIYIAGFNPTLSLPEWTWSVTSIFMPQFWQILNYNINYRLVVRTK